MGPKSFNPRQDGVRRSLARADAPNLTDGSNKPASPSRRAGRGVLASQDLNVWQASVRRYEKGDAAVETCRGAP